MKRKGLVSVVMLLMTTASINYCRAQSSGQHADSNFVMMAAMSNFAEISAGQLAAQKAKDPSVVAFGKMMVADHTAASRQLKTLAAGMNAPDSLDASHQALKDSLTTLTGAEFDKVYIQSQLRDHQLAVDLFQQEASSGQQPELKAFATKLLPKLKTHLEHATAISEKNK